MSSLMTSGSGGSGGAAPSTPVIIAASGGASATRFDFTGLTADDAATIGYRLTFCGYFSGNGQLYLRLNADSGNNYAETDFWTVAATPLVPASLFQGGVTLVNIGSPQGVAYSQCSGYIELDAIKTGFRRQGNIVCRIFESGGGTMTIVETAFDWITATGQLTQITIGNTGTLAAGSFASLQTLKTY